MNNRSQISSQSGIDQQLLLEALNAFQTETNIEVVDPQVTRSSGIDARIQMMNQNRLMEFKIEVRATVNDLVISRLSQQFEAHPGNWLLITRYVPLQLAERLKDLKIQFIDTVGNAYIDGPRKLIFIAGKKPPRLLQSTGERSTLNRAGIHVVFALLCNQGLESKNYREIAHASNVALGTVAGVLKDLVRQGYLVALGGEVRRLVRKKELLDKWISAYAERLRHKNLIGRYTANRMDFWRESDLLQLDAQWGGEVAANKLTHYLRPEVVAIYARRPVLKLVLGLRLRKDEKGNVELFERFWRFDSDNVQGDLVPPLLVYADLLATSDARNIETAHMIYRDELKRHFE